MPTLTTLVTFNGTNGASPFGTLIADAAGDLFGTTAYDGANGFGTVFEVANTPSGYASTPTVLVSFDGSIDGEVPGPGLIADAAGDLFGTAAYGGAGGDGTVFEIPNTASGYPSMATVLVSFNTSDGADPKAVLATDSAGDLFGTTEYGGTGGNGTVFEIAKTAGGYASTPTVLVSFNSTDGANPTAGLLTDASGDLFGTTQNGGASGDGTVFEVANTPSGYANTPTVLVSFNATNGEEPANGLITDAAGDLFGTTYGGGANSDGTVFEIVKTASGYASTPTILVSFNGTDGQDPTSGLITDAAGNIFGTTEYGGSTNDGTVFEIAKTASGYATTPITLFSFSGANGAEPAAGLMADAAGDLLGSTDLGGSTNDGTVFELTNTGFQVACYGRGTMIATPDGSTQVEKLMVGDLVRTAHGAVHPVIWLGHRHIDCRRHADPDRVLPVRVRAHAFADGQPGRDLLLSPDHAVFADGVLIPIKHLINGHSIAQVDCDDVEYWHVKLAHHDILLAEGLAAESYLDTGNRHAFVENGNIALHPDFSPLSWDDACAELVEQGPTLLAVKQRLFERAAIPASVPALMLEVSADGHPLEPTVSAYGDWHYRVPKGARLLNLVSPPWSPTACFPTSLDRRRLGVRLFGVAINGQTVTLDDDALCSGFHATEQTAEGACRWTTGNARLVLPLGVAKVTLRVGDGAVPHGGPLAAAA